ncbi:YodC family protein [Cupriavidus campinensis]|uniref:YodC family protein n=1 Tax=Cupriavidus campinensis TaxID=151783 RepID=UPI00165684E9|nr:DUF2158 domain-containing protein [Cupriavidus campinensis]
MSFKEGDVVQLRSGGPKMTVTGVVGQDSRLQTVAAVAGYEDGDVSVEYFDGAKLEKKMFKKTSVELV